MPAQRLRRPLRTTVTRIPAATLARVLAPVLAATLALALLTGCGGVDEPGAGTASRTPDVGASTTTPPKSEPAPDPGFQAAKVGQCYRMRPGQSRASVATGRPVRCGARHTTVVVQVGLLPKAVTPRTPVAQRRKLGERVCQPAYRRAVGGTLADRATSILTWTLFTPDRAQLERGARWVRCDVLARSGDALVPLPRTLPFLAAGVPEQLRVCQSEAGTDVSCSLTHAYRVEAVYQAAGGAYPDTSTYTPLARQRCKELTGEDGGFWQPPSEAEWRSGDRFIRCLKGAS